MTLDDDAARLHFHFMEMSKRPSDLVDRIRKALENVDLDAYATLFAEDAVLEEVSSLDPPAHPLVARGRDAIRRRLESEMLHDPISGWSRRLVSGAVVDHVETDDAIAFTEVRAYEAGDRVIAQHLARKSGGSISHDRVVVAWDATT